MASLQDAKKELSDQIRKKSAESIEKAEDITQKRIIGTASQRLADSLAILDCIDTNISVVAKKKSVGSVIAGIILHPIVTIILLVCVLVFLAITVTKPGTSAQSGNQLWIILSFSGLGLLFVQMLSNLIEKAKNGSAQRNIVTSDIDLDMSKANLFVIQQTGKFSVDSKAIAAMFQEDKLKDGSTYESNLIKLFVSLYEAKLDNPGLDDLNYGLSLCRIMMRQIGIGEVEYSEENAKFFSIRMEDYRDEMRHPAIIRAKTGDIIVKGEYIKALKKTI